MTGLYCCENLVTAVVMESDNRRARTRFHSVSRGDINNDVP